MPTELPFWLLLILLKPCLMGVIKSVFPLNFPFFSLAFTPNFPWFSLNFTPVFPTISPEFHFIFLHIFPFVFPLFPLIFHTIPLIFWNSFFLNTFFFLPNISENFPIFPLIPQETETRVIQIPNISLAVFEAMMK